MHQAQWNDKMHNYRIRNLSRQVYFTALENQILWKPLWIYSIFHFISAAAAPYGVRFAAVRCEGLMKD
jgi:hypothetical protein